MRFDSRWISEFVGRPLILGPVFYRPMNNCLFHLLVLTISVGNLLNNISNFDSLYMVRCVTPIFKTIWKDDKSKECFFSKGKYEYSRDITLTIWKMCRVVYYVTFESILTFSSQVMCNFFFKMRGKPIPLIAFTHYVESPRHLSVVSYRSTWCISSFSYNIYFIYVFILLGNIKKV